MNPFDDLEGLSIRSNDLGWIGVYYEQFRQMMTDPEDAEMAVDLDRVFTELGVTVEDFRGYPPRLYEANLVWDSENQIGFSRTRLYIGLPDQGKRIVLCWDAVEGRWEVVER